jgi:uncharacterized protein YkwD
MESDLSRLINADRAASRLPPLSLDRELAATALDHCREMSAQDRMNHASGASSSGPMARYLTRLKNDRARQPRYLVVAENIAHDRIALPNEAASDNRLLMASPPHRAIILGNRFQSMGVGVYKDNRGEIWVTEMFMGNRP